MSEIRFPVFVRLKDCGDVRQYESRSEMQRYFEPIDVENDEYEAWDGTATRLKLSVRKQADWLLLEPIGMPTPESLLAAISEFARLQGVPVDSSTMGRGDFSAALEHISATRTIRLKQVRQTWWQKLKHRF